MKRPAAKPALEPTPEVSNDDILTAVRRVEKAVKLISDDIEVLSDDIAILHNAIPKASLPPNDGPAPPEPPAAEAAPAGN